MSRRAPTCPALPRPRPWARAAALAIGAAGCGSIDGQWLGACDFGDARYSYTALLDVSFEDGSGVLVAGEVTLDMFDGRSFRGDVEGKRSDTYIEVEGLLTEDNVSGYNLVLAGDLEDQAIDGTCQFKVPGGAGALTGDMRLER